MLTECVYPRKCIGALRPLRTLISVPKALVPLIAHLYPSVFISSDDMVTINIFSNCFHPIGSRLVSVKPWSFCGSELWCGDHVSRKQQFNRKNVKLMSIATHHFLLGSNCRECYNHTWVLWNLKAPKLTFFR